MLQQRDYHVEWFDLQKQSQERLRQFSCGVHGDWDSLVMRLRKFRESVIAAGAPAELRRAVYEISADVCAAANNMAELLKCLQQLVNNIYPSLQRQQHQQPQQVLQQSGPPTQQQQQPSCSVTRTINHQPWKSAWSADPDDLDAASTAGDSSSSSNSAWGYDQDKHAVVAAALLLYFACVPKHPVIQEIIKQLRAAAKPRFSNQPSTALICSAVYQRAVQYTTAALRCQWQCFLRALTSHPEPPLLIKAVMAHHVDRLRLQAVTRLGVAYRMLPSSTFHRWMWPTQQAGVEAGPQATDKQAGSSSYGSSSQEHRKTETQDGCCGIRDSSDALAFQQVAHLLKRACEEGSSKAACLAASQCEGLHVLPATLHFRPQQAL